MKRLAQLEIRCPACGSQYVTITQTKTLDRRDGQGETATIVRRYCRCNIGDCLARFAEDVMIHERRIEG